MLISEYLALRNQISVTTGNTAVRTGESTAKDTVQNGSGTFAQALQEKLVEKHGVEFSKHAMQRVEERSIDLSENDTLDRLNRGVELAAGKGSSETLVLVGRNAFVVSVKNNKVITTLSDNELQGNVFTNIDSTVIV